MSLAKYKQKRTFSKTPEPTGGKSDNKELHFVIQKHDASHLHYDFRLEMKGVLKSWAVPKGPSMDPKVKRLAMMVEDHPYDYKDFEGVIPAGNYGAGTVIVWDEGTYVPQISGLNKKGWEKELLHAIENGKLHFILEGEKLKGEFALVKTHGRGENSWLLMKIKDEYAATADVTKKEKSVLSGRTLKQVEKDPEMVWKSNREEKVDKTKSTPKKPVKEDPATHPPVKKIAAPPAGDFSTLLSKGKKAPMPKKIKPMLATLTEKPFDKKDWLYEIKWDGYRAISYINKGNVTMLSRNQLSFNEKFDVIADSLKEWNAKAIIDGEIVALNKNGNPDFQALQNYLKTGKSVQLAYYVFDLLWYDGKDITQLPLLERKEILQQVLPQDNNLVRYSEHITGENGQGTAFFKAALKKGLEGVMAKNADSSYSLGRRTDSWLKIKNNLQTEAIICGYTAGRNSRKHFGALILGKYKNSVLHYIGHTGGGFDTKSLKELYEKFQPLVTDKSPFKVKPKTNMPATWIKPELVCEVKFAEETREGILRQPIFLGLREDKSAKNEKKEKVVAAPVSDKKTKTMKKTAKPEKVVENLTAKKATPKKSAAPKATAEKPAAKKAASPKATPPAPKATAKTSATSKKSPSKKKPTNTLLPEDQNEVEIKIDGKLLKFTNLDKIYWPDENITKRDMLNYYAAISDTILPYLIDRPQSLNRFPDGIKGFHFYQKNVEDKVADWIQTFPYISESDGETKNFLVCKDKASLLYMANLGCIELNPWHSRIKKPDNPDYCLIDLDPDTNDFNEVIQTALEIKKLLDDVGADSYIKTSGSTGMHILIPLGAKYTFDQSRMLAELIVQVINKRLPDITSIERSPNKRKGKIYLDFLQNRQIQTMAVAYSLRPKPGATVSAPLKWEEVRKGLTIQHFDIFNMPDRIAKEGDLLKGVLGKGINMQQVLKKLQKFI
ncbi:non-homologous end-joining DNA ligase [Chitinophaga sancti]|uniref:non-homologous end-joining DNA ligase n=1 Tax=Chitinophaga sancti TaxID=1004 RepID=UPI002A756E36|nr:non-homologous end-joining DNA ligase [Chitinophaga sancti]WPQ61082.1 non-homologous end-joining DNA ligase [Chitinophaga sancti]